MGKLGGRLVTVIVRGDVSAVTEAVEAAAARAIKKPVAKAVIANPHSETRRMVAISATRLKDRTKAEPVQTGTPEGEPK